MLPEAELHEAVEIQRRTYRLLLWMQTAVQKGFVSFRRAHSYATDAGAATAWIREHFANLPPDARPRDCSQRHLRPFSNLLASYVVTSFDLVETPGRRFESRCGCLCPICRYVVLASHVRVRGVTRSDRARAARLRAGYVCGVAEELGAALSEDAVGTMQKDDCLREAMALATYGAQLLLRVQGHREGGALLALWREFAWTKAGSPKRGYVLDADRILAAERLVRARVGDLLGASSLDAVDLVHQRRKRGR